MMDRPDRIVPAGALVLLSGGRDEEQYAAGLYRVAADLDLDDLTERHLATVPPGAKGFARNRAERRPLNGVRRRGGPAR